MINLLDIHIANLIAAGEVVDRPSSALKELVENSIDAGATSVTVEIKGGGIAYIRVTDNGIGMDAEDLGRSVLRHATSKIKDEKDLAKITTLGFRGEALAAVSSVSDIKIFTKVKNAQNGYMLESSSGQNTKISEAGCANGTTVIIERLFSKIPARQKFLKRDITEGMYCKWITEKIALSNPSVSFKFIQDEKQKIFTPGNGSYKDTVYSVFGDKIAENLISVGDVDKNSQTQKNQPDEVIVYGFISKIENGQKTRVNENFFVNGRYVYSKTIMSAMEEAYKSISHTGTFPVCALYVKVDETSVDINVHPQKMEVKFSDERKIYSSVYYAVKEALSNSGSSNIINTAIFPKYPEKKTEENSIFFNSVLIRGEKEEIRESPPAIKIETIETNNDFKSKYFDLPSFRTTQETQKIETETYVEQIKNIKNDEPIKFVNNIHEYKIMGEAFYGYIFVEKGEKIIIIDKHAAHERIIYDIILKKAADSNINSEFKSQILLVPVEIKLTPKEAAGIIDIENDMKKLGIISEWKDEETIFITEVPPEIFDVNIEEIIKEAAYLSSEGNLSADKTAFENLAMLSAKKYAACRAAMKSGIIDSAENIAWLVDRVLNYEDVKYCPHGRPVAFEITKDDIEKQFKR